MGGEPRDSSRLSRSPPAVHHGSERHFELNFGFHRLFSSFVCHCCDADAGTKNRKLPVRSPGNRENEKVVQRGILIPRNSYGVAWLAVVDGGCIPSFIHNHKHTAIDSALNLCSFQENINNYRPEN